MQITSGWTLLHSWPALSPMCMVWGCFGTILKATTCCFLHAESLLQAQSCCCCWAPLQRQALPFPSTHTSCANVNTLVCVLNSSGHIKAKSRIKLNNKQQKTPLHYFFWILDTPPLTQRWPVEAAQVDISILHSSEQQQFIAAVWLIC